MRTLNCHQQREEETYTSANPPTAHQSSRLLYPQRPQDGAVLDRSDALQVHLVDLKPRAALDSVDDVYAWKEWLESRRTAVIGPLDHQVLLSIYFFDPTSNCRLELTTPLTRLSDRDAKDAEKALDQWEVWREEATVSDLAFGDFLRQKLQMRAKHVA